MGRIVSLLALPKEVPGMVVNRYCGSGLESIAIAAQRIHSGMADLILAGGVESMSMVPVMGWKTALNYSIASTHGDFYTSMGLTAEMVARAQCCGACIATLRKVGTSQDKVLVKARSGKPDISCNRK